MALDLLGAAQHSRPECFSLVVFNYVSRKRKTATSNKRERSNFMLLASMPTSVDAQAELLACKQMRGANRGQLRSSDRP